MIESITGIGGLVLLVAAILVFAVWQFWKKEEIEHEIPWECNSDERYPITAGFMDGPTFEEFMESVRKHNKEAAKQEAAAKEAKKKAKPASKAAKKRAAKPAIKKNVKQPTKAKNEKKKRSR